MKEKTLFFQAQLKVLHVAPEQCFHGQFKQLKNIDYYTADLESPLAEYHFDLHDIPFEANTFDVIICNHVLEHVQDDRRCASEMYRVLKPGAWAIMQVPIDYSREATYEDKSIVTPEAREEHFWQKDHVRLFGRDYPERLRESGFNVNPDKFVQDLSPSLRERYRLQEEEIVYFLEKK